MAGYTNLKSDGNGIVLNAAPLSYGEYKLIETSAPGYYKAAEIEFTLNDYENQDKTGLEIISRVNGEAAAECKASTSNVDGVQVTTYSYTIIVKNTAVNWQIVKRSSSSEQILLEGAEFTLTKEDNHAIQFTGESDKNGVIAGFENVPDGSYILTETKAPAGYSLGQDWIITIQNGFPAITTQNGEDIDSEIIENKLTFYYEDDVLYSLPSTGGSGTYWYLISGTLLMMAASMILYKNRRKEVLKG